MKAREENNFRRALEVFEHLEGTLIADLKSLKACALTPKKRNSGQGALNYTIFLVALVGCETIGRYVYGADLDKKEKNSTPDAGGYINRFIEKYFPKKDHYKSISKILSDYLRHILVHGFAPRKDGYPFDLHLVISKDGTDLPPLACEKNNRLVIKLDGISFLNKVLTAFETIKRELSKDANLANNIVVAEDYGKNISPPKEVTNQFIASFPKLKKES